jgi:uncharacterized membrane protein YtjA (UPF0391 family)
MLHFALVMLVVVLTAALFCCAVVANYVAEWAKFVFFNYIALTVRSMRRGQN